jgi:hypothetical protein
MSSRAIPWNQESTGTRKAWRLQAALCFRRRKRGLALCSIGLICGLLLTSLPAVRAQQAGAQPQRELLGLSLGMSKEAAQRRLRELGQLEREERGRQEVWKISAPSFAYLLVGFDPQARLRYVTALARAGGPRLRYRAVGDLKQARSVGAPGNYQYIWELAARGEQPRTQVIVRGADAEYLSAYSLKKVE